MISYISPFLYSFENLVVLESGKTVNTGFLKIKMKNAHGRRSGGFRSSIIVILYNKMRHSYICCV